MVDLVAPLFAGLPGLIARICSAPTQPQLPPLRTIRMATPRDDLNASKAAKAAKIQADEVAAQAGTLQNSTTATVLADLAAAKGTLVDIIPDPVTGLVDVYTPTADGTDYTFTGHPSLDSPLPVPDPNAPPTGTASVAHPA